MANRPQGTAWNRRLGGPSASASSGGDRNWESVEQLVLDLENPDLRENALLILSKERGAFPDLATLLWSSFGAVVALLQEIVSIYPHLSSPNLTAVASNRVCNAIALLQCMASHPKNRVLFINAHMPLYLYPFLNTITKTRPFEYLRVSSLGVIAALLKVNDGKAINFLLSTEIIPLCLQSMEMGTELSKTVSTVIIQKILLDDVGLRKICATAQRFFAVHRMLGSMISSPTEQPSSRLLKYIIRCYLRLSDNPRASEVLKNCLPEMLKEAAVKQVFHDDPTAMLTLEQLLYNLSGTRHVVI